MPYDTHIVLDFEFNPTKKEHRHLLKDEIIQVGVIKLNSQYEEIDRMACTVKPQFNDFIAKTITDLTGIRTCDVVNGTDFKTMTEILSDWIGHDSKARIYSWSNSDLAQLQKECRVKNVPFPANMGRWMDLQMVFQRIMREPKRKRWALGYAAKMIGVNFSNESAHQAMYDTEVTAEILKMIKTEGFISNQYKSIQKVLTEDTRSSYTIGSIFGDVLSSLVLQPAVA